MRKKKILAKWKKQGYLRGRERGKTGMDYALAEGGEALLRQDTQSWKNIVWQKKQQKTLLLQELLQEIEIRGSKALTKTHVNKFGEQIRDALKQGFIQHLTGNKYKLTEDVRIKQLVLKPPAELLQELQSALKKVVNETEIIKKAQKVWIERFQSEDSELESALSQYFNKLNEHFSQADREIMTMYKHMESLDLSQKARQEIEAKIKHKADEFKEMLNKSRNKAQEDFTRQWQQQDKAVEKMRADCQNKIVDLEKRLYALEAQYSKIQDSLQDSVQGISREKFYKEKTKPALAKANLLEMIREHYSRTYYNHKGDMDLGELLSYLEGELSWDRKTIKLEIVQLKNQGKLRLCSAINMKYLEERNVIFEGNEIYFAVQILDLML